MGRELVIQTGIIWGLVLWYVLACHSLKVNAIDNNNVEGLSSPAYDYKDVLAKAILFFEGQRSGKLPASQRVDWRGDSALSDGKPDNVILTKYSNLRFHCVAYRTCMQAYNFFERIITGYIARLY